MLDDYVRAAAQAAGVRIEAMLWPTRGLEHVSAYRQAGMKAARDDGYTYTAIGAAFGRDHTTVMSNCRKAPPERVERVREALA